MFIVKSVKKFEKLRRSAGEYYIRSDKPSLLHSSNRCFLVKMQSRAVFSLCIILLTSVVSSSYHSSVKLRRDGVLNLYPFPRVGRSSSHTWQIPINEKMLNPVAFKRQLYAFPRVGRAMSLGDPYHYVKRQSLEPHAFDTVGMFFGPRLGRTYPADDVDIPENEAGGGEPEQLEPHSDREKRNAKAT